MLEGLPVELILLLLRGSSIADILNLSRTSSYFRSISFLNRRLWIDASDPYRIRFPLGETLKTTDLSRLPRYAARSTAILNKYRHHLHHDLAISPIRTYEATRLYDLPAWNFWSPAKYSQRSFLGHVPPTFMNVLPAAVHFYWGPWVILGYMTSAANLVAEVDWDSVDNGVNIVLAIISKAFNERRDLESYLSVFKINYVHSAKAPSVCRTHVLELPIDATVVSIEGDLVLVRNSADFLLFDLAARRRGWWHLRDSEITHASILTERTMSLAVKFHKTGVHRVQTINISSDMVSFADAGSPFWTAYPPMRGLETILAPLRSSYHTMLAAVDIGTLTVLRTDSDWDAGEVRKWLTLSFPVEGMPGVGRTVVFDDVYGIALAFARGRLFVMQY
ncbi:hypothetical protein K438DRAFT_1984420 [Mycena galopus ATCC 62051]|nr:hypothetical protein K438DRAFT_1984420 [Mycena galopus ATCC 62051]